VDATIKHWDGPGLDAWHPWHPKEVAAQLAGVEVPWCVVGGWAIELFLDQPHRHHEDIEIAIPRVGFSSLRMHLASYALHTVGDGEVRILPADGDPPEDRHQSWVLDETQRAWRMDIMLEPGDSDTWVFRRDARISAPRSRMVQLSGEVPCLRPEGVLLYKAKARRDKDEWDFRACLPRMDQDARSWFADALDVAHPAHDWIAWLRQC
jgi:hypothetical protein